MDAFLLKCIWYAVKARVLGSHYHHIYPPASGGSYNRLGVCCSAGTKFSLVVLADLVNSWIPVFSDPEDLGFVIAETQFPSKRVFASPPRLHPLLSSSRASV